MFSLQINNVFIVGKFPVKFKNIFNILLIKSEKSLLLIFLYKPGDKPSFAKTLLLLKSSFISNLFSLNYLCKYLLIVSTLLISY